MSLTANAQKASVSGKVSDEDGKAVAQVQVFIDGTEISTTTSDQGDYNLKNIKPGEYQLVAFYPGLQTASSKIVLKAGKNEVNFNLKQLESTLDEVTIKDKREQTTGIRRLNAVEGFSIYDAKKNEVIVLDDVVANKASNNARQIFAKVSGLNIWESDCAGLQIGVGGRGLSPNRNSNFNTRQNGYDISADALGYPESYYSPAIQAVDRVEIVRGAASLQYGTQFGGLVNFVMKKGPEDKKIEFNTAQTGNSLGFYSGFNSVGGTVGKVNYYVYNRYAKGECWRCNSDFESNTTFANVNIAAGEKVDLSVDYTNMHYLAQQPGGLTDALFEEDPQQSIRDRNWFRVDWNLMSLKVNYRITDKLKVNFRNFALIGGRDALGNLGRIDRTDDLGERNLFVDDFTNFGNETRFIHNYKLGAQPSVLLVGGRYYHGLTKRKQGNGPAGDGADFNFLNPDNLEGSDYEFPGENISAFAENVFNLTDKWSVTPGVRFEHIKTEAQGYYQDVTLVVDPNTGLGVDSTFQVYEDKSRTRSFVFFGVGSGYKYSQNLELYANYSQNYRSINFNDIRVENPNLQVDENIHDEKGYNVELGVRGNKPGIINYDISLFYLKYKDRIGSVLKVDQENFRIYRYRTNISDSRNIGLEAFAEVNVNHWLKLKKVNALNIFANVSVIDAMYVDSDEEAISGNEVELVPPFSLKTGVNASIGRLKLAYQFSYTQQQYSDASNAEKTPSAVEGIIPTYYVMDLSGAYQFNQYFGIEAGINNLTNNYYFTRRASGYPGPGIIPSDGRSFYITLKGKIGK
ncbi:TonB-dependent receptor [Fulvivirga ligni]|uniref:TonB-dependent receptor n=1 Tax=Fulvivirga ligni TaxID=2904246 RepID=UPI001F2D80E5|nr:TonB-dependent receptor [Fulvivirga ligni]UII19827.1 TonB-dependent receptor [Fulvivirga ligni]